MLKARSRRKWLWRGTALRANPHNGLRRVVLDHLPGFPWCWPLNRTAGSRPGARVIDTQRLRSLTDHAASLFVEQYRQRSGLAAGHRSVLVGPSLGCQLNKRLTAENDEHFQYSPQTTSDLAYHATLAAGDAHARSAAGQSARRTATGQNAVARARHRGGTEQSQTWSAGHLL